MLWWTEWTSLINNILIHYIKHSKLSIDLIIAFLWAKFCILYLVTKVYWTVAMVEVCWVPSYFIWYFGTTRYVLSCEHVIWCPLIMLQKIFAFEKCTKSIFWQNWWSALFGCHGDKSGLFLFFEFALILDTRSNVIWYKTRK